MTANKKKWRFRNDMLIQYINGVSDKTFQDAEDRLNELESIVDDFMNKPEDYSCSEWDIVNDYRLLRNSSKVARIYQISIKEVNDILRKNGVI